MPTELDDAHRAFSRADARWRGEIRRALGPDAVFLIWSPQARGEPGSRLAGFYAARTRAAKRFNDLHHATARA